MDNTITQTKQDFKTNHKDIHQLVTDTIISQLESGVIPWQKPWNGPEQVLPGLPVNFTTRNKYRGINILLLWCATLKNSFQSNEWASFKQWQSKGESIRKGEKGSLVVYYDTFEKEVDGEKVEIPFLKSSFVFNRNQLASYEPETFVQLDNQEPFDRISEVETFIANTKAELQWHHGGACYIPSQDIIKMPYPEQFINTESCTATEGYYSTALHELTHWSGSEKRLNRVKGKKFGDQNYAAEELVAEFGAAFLCAGFGINTLPKGDHAAYIDHWVKVLKENNRCLFTAASDASKAVDFLYALQPQLTAC